MDVPGFDSPVGIDNNVKQQTTKIMNNQDKIFKQVNDIVLEGLKRDGMKWFMPWKPGEEFQPMNHSSKTYYKGFNVFMLNAVMTYERYEFNQWLTYKQCKANGGQVNKGEKSTQIYFWKIGYFDQKTEKYLSDKEIKKANLSEKIVVDGTTQNRYKKTFSVRYYNVFNVAQCDGIDPIVFDQSEITKANEPIKVADDLAKSYVDRDGKLRLEHLQDRAFYNVNRDMVNMPKLESFVDSDSYYKVLFHELAHSTGHKDRMDRKSLTEVSNWGDNTYAKEELVAEISAMYISGMLGLDPKDCDQNSVAYIKGWCKHLSDKPKECLYAMQQATKVVAYIQGN